MILVCKTGWVPVLALAIASVAPAAWSQEEAARTDGMTPPSELDADAEAALARAGTWLNEWNGETKLLEAARVEIERVLAANPDSAEAHRRHAHYLFNRAMRTGSDYDAEGLAQAEKALDRALELDPGDSAAHLMRVSVYRLQKRMEEAWTALHNAEKLRPEPALLHERWADLLMDERKPEQALAHCRRIEEGGPALQDAADRCAIPPLHALQRLDEVDRLYRDIIRRTPGSAWDHGNHARFLLCSRREAKEAADAAVRALDLMNYPHARLTLAAALYRHWAELTNAGKRDEADAPWLQAAALMPGAPAMIVAEACHAGFARPVLKALRDARRGPVFSPVEGVLLASEFAPDWVPGVFVLKVQGSGRGRGKEAGQVFLNSEADYRDPRNITVRFTPKAATAFRDKHGVDPDAQLNGKFVLVYGYARQVRIDFMQSGVPSGKYYFQTHIAVTDPDQVSIYDPNEPAPPPPSPPPPGTRA
jgi:tetratricopeptide (TPR) repeat protein